MGQITSIAQSGKIIAFTHFYFIQSEFPEWLGTPTYSQNTVNFCPKVYIRDAAGITILFLGFASGQSLTPLRCPQKEVGFVVFQLLIPRQRRKEMYITCLLQEIPPYDSIINTGIVSLVIKGKGVFEFNATTITVAC